MRLLSQQGKRNAEVEDFILPPSPLLFSLYDGRLNIRRPAGCRHEHCPKKRIATRTASKRSTAVYSSVAIPKSNESNTTMVGLAPKSRERYEGPVNRAMIHLDGP